MDDQTAVWNGPAGHAWVEQQEVLDAMFAPLERLLAGEVRAGERVLDVGCGTGATTRAAARAAGPEGRCLGLDLSQPMIDAARARPAEPDAAPVELVAADAQRHAFGDAAFDVVISRFGVMFFPDPVRAFANLRGATADGGRLRALTWRAPEENPFMTTAERAARPLLPDLPPRDPDAAGQFAFADADRVRGILEGAGWRAVEHRPVDVECRFPAARLTDYLTRLGPLGFFLADADEDTRARVVAAVRGAFDPFVHGDEVRYTAACWMVEAQA